MNREPEEPQGGLPRHYLRAALLLLIAESPGHGYDLLEQIGQLGLHAGDPGGVYRGLRALERGGYVESWWEHSSSGPPRRTYRLSPKGLRHLESWTDALRDTRRHLSVYLDRYDSLRRERPPAGRTRSAGPSTVAS